MASMTKTNPTAQTIQDFGSEWTRFPANEGYYSSLQMLADYMGPLAQTQDLQGLPVIDIGSGTGRIVNMLLDAGAALVYAVEPSQAMEPCKQNTAARAGQVRYLQMRGDQIPALEAAYAVSLGVLHHIPEPAATVRAVYAALRPGGKFLAWVYGVEGNSLYLGIFNPIRGLCARLPDGLLVFFSRVLALFLAAYIFLCKFLPLPMRRYMRGVLAHFSRQQLVLTIFDQLNPTHAKYYTQAEAIDLLAAGGFQNVRVYHRHHYSWTILGEKPLDPAP